MVKGKGGDESAKGVVCMIKSKDRERSLGGAATVHRATINRATVNRRQFTGRHLTGATINRSDN